MPRSDRVGDHPYPFIAIVEGEVAIVEGEVAILDGDRNEIIRHGPSGFFGELILLTHRLSAR